MIQILLSTLIELIKASQIFSERGVNEMLVFLLGVAGSIATYIIAKKKSGSLGIASIYTALFFLVLIINTFLLTGTEKSFVLLMLLGSIPTCFILLIYTLIAKSVELKKERKELDMLKQGK